MELLSTCGRVLLTVQQAEGSLTVRRLSQALDLSEGTVVTNLQALEKEGYLAKTKVGRLNHYQVLWRLTFNLERDHTE